MRRFTRGITVVGVLLALAACAANPFRSGPQRPEDRNVLEREAIEHFSDARQAVETLRSDWLRARLITGLYTSGHVWVYLDGVKLGDVGTLRAMSTLEIASIRYYDGLTASARWGLGHENGVIFVTSRVR